MKNSHETMSPEYSGIHAYKTFSLYNLFFLFGNILRSVGLVDWFSVWTKKRYCINLTLNLIFFKIVMQTCAKLSYNKRYTRRRFGELIDGTIGITVLGSELCSFDLMGSMFILIHMIIDRISRDIIQEIVGDRSRECGEDFFDFEKTMVIINNFKSTGEKLYELYERKEICN